MGGSPWMTQSVSMLTDNLLPLGTSSQSGMAHPGAAKQQPSREWTVDW
jgi:hypothetical protein